MAASGHMFCHDDYTCVVNGKSFPVYSYDQLEPLHQRQLSRVVQNLQEALGLEHISIPKHKDHQICWVLEQQGKAMNRQPAELGVPQTRYHRSSSPGRHEVSPCEGQDGRHTASFARRTSTAAFQQDHFVNIGTIENEARGLHGQLSDGDFEGGLERGIGRGKSHISRYLRDHFVNQGMTTNEKPGRHGHARDDDFQDGIERGIGHGKKHISRGTLIKDQCFDLNEGNITYEHFGGNGSDSPRGKRNVDGMEADANMQPAGLESEPFNPHLRAQQLLARQPREMAVRGQEFEVEPVTAGGYAPRPGYTSIRR